MIWFWTDRKFVLASVSVLGILALPLWAQKGGGAGTGAGGGAGAGGVGNVGSTGTRGTTGSIPNLPGTSNLPSNWPGNSPTNNRLFWFSGKVMFDDGSPANSDIRIERVCAGNPRLEAHTDAKGRFSFQLGNNMTVDTDAADAQSGVMGPGQPMGSLNSPANSPLNRADPLWNCELRAAYPGYRSDEIELANHREMDNSDIGTIVLHRLVNVKGSTISVTSALAPKHAQKDYEKALQLAQKGSFADAEKHLQEAVDTYPKYAAAWFTLGEVQTSQNKLNDAKHSFQQAITADSHFVSPYDQLALLADREGRWQDAADISKQAISLNPVEFPSAFWYNAVANFNLRKRDEAEKSALELVKLDTGHKYPEVENLLAQISLDRGDYSGAATHLKSYIALVPNAKNADTLKQELLKIEQASAAKGTAQNQ